MPQEDLQFGKITVIDVDITPIGELTVEFDKDINTTLLEEFNGEAMNDFITLQLLRETPIDDTRNLNFTWIISGVSERSIEFFLDFEEPHYVSGEMSGPDRMLVWFTLDPVKQGLMFINRTLAFTPSRVNLKKQMYPGLATAVVTKSSESANGGFQVLFWVGLVMQFLGSDALNIMGLMVRTYQFILHLPMFQMNMPGNVIMLYENVLPIVCWDMLDHSLNWETQPIIPFGDLEEEAPFPGQLEELGYETSNFMMNTSTIAILMLIYTVKLLIYGLLRLLVCCFPCCEGEWLRWTINGMHSSLFFADLIVLTVESYMEFMIAGYLTLRQPHFEKLGDKLSYGYASLAVSLALLFLPIILAKIWKKKFQVLQSDRYQGVVG